jgi:hypothetical protein
MNDALDEMDETDLQLLCAKIEAKAKEIRFSGKAWAKLMKALNKDGVGDLDDKPWTKESLRAFCEQHKILEAVTGRPSKPKSKEMSIEGRKDGGESAPSNGATDTGQEIVAEDEEKSKTPPEPKSTAEKVNPGSTNMRNHESASADATLPGAPPEPLDDQTIADLRAMLKWWKESAASPSQVITPAHSGLANITARPAFKRSGGGGERTPTKTIRLGAEMVQRAEKAAKKHKAVTGGTFSGLVEVLIWQYLGCPDDLLQDTED